MVGATIIFLVRVTLDVSPGPMGWLNAIKLITCETLDVSWKPIVAPHKQIIVNIAINVGWLPEVHA